MRKHRVTIKEDKILFHEKVIEISDTQMELD